MKRVFISHPFASNPERNKRRVDAICRHLIKQGVLPISPLHLFAFCGNDNSRDEIMAVCYRLIDICDEVRVYGDSAGTQAETRYAWSVGKPVIDYTVTDWDKFIRERSAVDLGGTDCE